MTVIDESGAEVAERLPQVRAGLDALGSLAPRDQVNRVTELLVASNAQLQVCIYAQDLPGIVNVKADAKLIEAAVKQRKLGKEMQDNASEFLRRAERGLGVAIREAQERGELSSLGTRKSYGNAHGTRSRDSTLSSPSDYLPHGSDRKWTYEVTDNVSDDDFEDVLGEARSEDNLSRANVARKCKARAAEVAPGITADELDALNVKPTPTVDERSMRIFNNLESTLDGIVITLRYLKYDQLDRSEVAEKCESVDNSLATIRKTIRNIRRHNGIA